MITADFSSSLARNSFEWFVRLRMAAFFQTQNMEFKLEKVHLDWVRHVTETKKDVCIVAARGHSKTTILSIALPVWMCFKADRPLNIVITSHNQAMANTILRGIKLLIDSDAPIASILKPDNPGAKWSESEIELKGGHWIYSLPFGEGIRGKHTDLTISDDIMKASETTNVQYVKDIFYSVIYPTTQARKGKHVIVGTPVSYTDLYHELESGQGTNTFDVYKYPALVQNELGDFVPNLPELYDVEQLMRIKATQPPHIWSREYMCQPLSSSTAIFPMDLLNRAVELGRRFGALRQQNRDLRATGQNVVEFVGTKFLGVDVALSESARADFNVITGIERFPDGTYDVSILDRRRGAGSAQVRQAVEELGKDFSRIAVEQQGLSYGMVLELQQGPLGGLVMGVKTDRKSKEEMLSRLEVLFRDGKIAIPDNPVLIEELQSFAVTISKTGSETFESLSAHDDCVMSLCMAVRAAEGAGQVSLSAV